MAMFGYMTDLDTVEVTEVQEIRAEGERCPAPSPLTPSTPTSPSHSFPPLYPLPTSPFLSALLSPLIPFNPLSSSPPLSPHPFQPTPSFPSFLSSSLLHSHPLGLSSFSSRTHINIWSASSTGEDLLSLLYHFLDEWLFLFSADPFFIPRVRGN